MAKDESRQIGASYGLTDISDGNKQQNFQHFGVKGYSTHLIILRMALFEVSTVLTAKIKQLILVQVHITALS